MTRSRVMNLRTGLTTCTTCGAQRSWDIQVCPSCVKRQEEAAESALQKKIEWQELNDRLDAHRRELESSQKRVVDVQHADGTQEIAPDFGKHLHQCGWCGEWYVGARVDHGCPPPQISAMEQDYIESFGAQTDAALSPELARDVLDDYNAYFDSVYGAEIHESPRDWQDMRGDLAV